MGFEPQTGRHRRDSKSTLCDFVRPTMTCRAFSLRDALPISTQRFRIGLIHRSAPPARDSGFWEAQKYRRFCSIVFAAAQTDGAFKETAPEARNRGSAQSRKRWVEES